MKQSQYYTLSAGICVLIALHLTGTMQIIAYVACLLSVIVGVCHTIIEAFESYYKKYPPPMKTYKKFKIHLVNGGILEYLEDDAKGVRDFMADWLEAKELTCVFGQSQAVPWHGVAMIEGVDDESKEK